MNRLYREYIWAAMVPFFALLGINVYAVSDYKLSIEKSNQCLVIDLLKDGKEAGHVELLYKDQIHKKCEIKEPPVIENNLPRVISLNQDVPRPTVPAATRTFAAKKLQVRGELAIDFMKGRTAIKVSLPHKNNKLELEIDSNGITTIHKAELQDAFTITGRYAHVRVPRGKILRGRKLTFDVYILLNDGHIHCNTGSFGATYLFENKGKLTTEGDCTLRIPSFFRNTGYEDAGILEVKGNLLFEGDGGTFDNRAGTVIAYKDAVVKAKSFINERLPKRKEEDKPLQTYTVYTEDENGSAYHERTCENNHEVAGSKAAFFKCYGTFTLVTGHGVNKQSVIHADGPIHVTAKNFENQQDQLVKNWCELKTIYLDPSTFRTVNRDSSSTLLPALITCGDSIEFILKGTRYTHKSGSLTGKVSGLTNSGHIRAQENISATMATKTAEDHIACVLNGLSTPANKLKPEVEYKAEMVSLVPKNIQKAIPEARLSPKNVYFKYVSSIHEVAHPIGVNEIVFRQGVVPKLKPTSKYLFSYQLQAQLLTQILYEQTTTSFLPHVTNDALAQFAYLKEMGFLYGLVHGILRELPNIPKSNIKVFVSDYDKQRLKEALRLFADKNQKITLESLENKLKQVRAGTHVLVLPPEKIISAPESFLYYDCEKEDIVPYVHIAKKDFDSNAKSSGKIEAKNVFLHVPIVVNNGSIVAYNKVSIKAQSFKNQRPVHKKINNHTTQDVWGNYHTYQYEIRTPQPGGQVLGFIVEVEVPEAGSNPQLAGHKGIQNKGGTIEGTCKVSLVAKQGNIENRHVLGTRTISLDRGFLASALGKPKRSLVHDFHAGQISSSQGDVELVSETGKVLTIASDVIAHNSVKIKGYGDVLLKTLTEPHAVLSDSRLSGVTYKEMDAEAFTVGLSRVIAHEGDVILKSKNTVENEGAYTQSGKDTVYDGQKGNKVGAAKVKTKITLYEAYLAYPPKAKTIVTEHLVQPEIKAGGKLEFLTELDNVIEAAIMTETGAIYVTAGRDNVFKGGQAKTTIDEHKFSIGINFFGKRALEQLWAKEPGAAVWSLAEEDPLVQSLLALGLSAKEGDAAGATGETLASSLEAARLLVNYKAQVKAAGENFSKGAFIGQRLGVTDGNGNFAPRIRVRFGYTNTAVEHVHQEQTTIKTGTFEAKSGRDTHLADGIKIEAQDINLEVHGNLETSAATSTTHTDIVDPGVHVDVTPQEVVGVGADLGVTTRHEQKHDQAELKADSVRIDVAGDFTQRGTTIEGKDTRINVGGDFVGESVQDTLEEQSHAGEATVGISGFVSGSYTYGSKNKAETEQVSGIVGTENLEVNVKGDIKTQGFVLESENPDSYIKAQSIKPGTLQDCDDTNTFGIGGFTTYPNSGPDGIHTIITPSTSYSEDDGITQTTIAGPIKLETEEPAPGINRDKSKMRTRYPKVVSSFRVAVPLIDLQKLSDTLVELGYANTPQKREEIEQREDEIIYSRSETIEEIIEEPKLNDQSSPNNNINEADFTHEEQVHNQQEQVKVDTSGSSTKQSTSEEHQREENQPDKSTSNNVEDVAPEEQPWYVADVMSEDADTTTIKVAMPLEAVDLDKVAQFLKPDLLREFEQKQQDLLLKMVERSLQGNYVNFDIKVNTHELQASGLTLDGLKSAAAHYVSKAYAKAKYTTKYLFNYSIGFTGGVVGSYIPLPYTRPLSEAEERGRRDGYLVAKFLGNLERTASAGLLGASGLSASIDDGGPGGRALSLALSPALAMAGVFALGHGTLVVEIADAGLQRSNLMLASPLQAPPGSSNNMPPAGPQAPSNASPRLSNQAYKDELERLLAQSNGVIQDLNIEELLDANKIKHIFVPDKHHFSLLSGSQEDIIYKIGRATIQADQTGLVKAKGVEVINLIVDGYDVTVEGIVLNGKMRWGTIYIPHKVGVCPINPCPYVKI